MTIGTGAEAKIEAKAEARAEATANTVGIETGVAGVTSERVAGVVVVIAGVISERVVGVIAGMMIGAKAGEMEGRGFRRREEGAGVTTGVVHGREKKWLRRRDLRQRLCRLRKAWTACRRKSWRGGEPIQFLTWPNLCLVRGSDSM